jgi:hypothetical protein
VIPWPQGLLILVLWIMPVLAGAWLGDRKGGEYQGLIVGLVLSALFSWLGVLAVLLWNPKPKR